MSAALHLGPIEGAGRPRSSMRKTSFSGSFSRSDQLSGETDIRSDVGVPRAGARILLLAMSALFWAGVLVGVIV